MDDRVSLHKLTVFEAVVALGSVSRAADRLFVAQPVVTMHIRRLEEQLGVRLFVRANRRMELTEPGRTVHRWASDVLRRSEELSRELVGLAAGTEGSIALVTSLTLGCYVLPPVLARFRRERPGLQLKVDIHDSTLALAAVEHGESDLAVVAVETSPAAIGLEAERLGVAELVLVTAPEGELPTAIEIDELATLAFVEGPNRERLDRQLERLGVRERNVVMELGHPEAVKPVVAIGLGVALLPRGAVARELEDGVLREVEIEDASVSLPIYAAHRRDKELSEAQRSLIDAIRPALAEPVRVE